MSDRYEAEQNAARKLFEAERALKEQAQFHVGDLERRRKVWARAFEQAMFDIDELTDEGQEQRAALFRAQEEQLKVRADATFQLGTMAMDLEAARAELEAARAELEAARAELEAARR